MNLGNWMPFEPQMMTRLIRDEVTALRDDDTYYAVCEREAKEKEELRMISRRYGEAVTYLKESEV